MNEKIVEKRERKREGKVVLSYCSSLTTTLLQSTLAER